MTEQSNKTSIELLSHLKEKFKTYSISLEWKQSPMKFIVIDGKSTPLNDSEKSLTNKLISEIENKWSYLDIEIKKNTVKSFLENI